MRARVRRAGARRRRARVADARDARLEDASVRRVDVARDATRDATYASGLATLESCVEAEQFDRAMMEELFDVADAMARGATGRRRSRLMLQGYLMSTLFYEPSTRTRLSFEAAMGRLGGGIVSTESAGEYSSAAKGETLEDTMRTVEGYADIVVLRHFTAGIGAPSGERDRETGHQRRRRAGSAPDASLARRVHDSQRNRQVGRL